MGSNKWTEAEINFLKENFANMSNSLIQKRLFAINSGLYDRSIASISDYAKTLGLKKSESFIKAQRATTNKNFYLAEKYWSDKQALRKKNNERLD